MPHDQDRTRFAELIADFYDASEPASLTADHWRPAQDDPQPRAKSEHVIDG